jgi:ABC-type multidrug transport system fused ATPase/permease subunit
MGHMGDPEQPVPTRLNKRAARRLLGWLKPYGRPIALNVFLTALLSVAGLLVPQLLRRCIDGIVETYKAVKGLGPVEAAAIKQQGWHQTLLLIGGFVLLFAVMKLVQNAEIRRVITFSQRFMAEMRERFFRHLHELSLSYYDKMKGGQIIARGTTDIDILEHTVSWAPNRVAFAIITLTGAVAFMLAMDWVLFLAVFPMVPALFLLTNWFRLRATRAWRQVRLQSGRLTANVAESIAGARVIQAFARSQKNEEIFWDLTSELYQTRIETERVRGRYMIGMRLLQTAVPAVVILVGAYRVAATAGPDPAGASVTAGTVVAFLAYVHMFFFPMEMMSEQYNQLLHALAAADRIIEVFDAEPDIVDGPEAARPEDFTGEVEFDGVTFEYAPGVPVLKEVSLQVKPGEVVALVGPTGAGKTTICRLLARFYEAQHGQVRIDGRDVRTIAQEALHRRMGIVLQENFLFAGTVMDNIRYGRPDATDAEVIECARRMGSHVAIEALPEGYQTRVGERGATVSAGQRQLICFTRAMLADPRILILDEATSSVDTETELRIQEALRRLTERRTSFIVAHRLSTVRRADRVCVIEGGRIVERGTHRELLDAGGRYAKMYREFIRSE